MLEPVIEQVHERAVITRSNYGYRVLNTPDLGIIDVDFNLEYETYPQQMEALCNLRQWVKEQGQSWTAYRTAKGLRLIRTDAPQPLDASYDAVYSAIGCGCDDLYRELCHEQKAFRARISPKPARCGIEYPKWNPFDARGGGWSCADPDGTRVPRAIRAYEILAEQFKVCELVEVVGPGGVHPSLYATVTAHDALCNVFSTLPLEPLAESETNGPTWMEVLAFDREYRKEGPQGRKWTPEAIWPVLSWDVREAIKKLGAIGTSQEIQDEHSRQLRLAEKWPRPIKAAPLPWPPTAVADVEDDTDFFAKLAGTAS